MSTKLSNETVIPLLPCSAYEATINFYQALGFTMTHAQQEPYVYIALRCQEVELHFSASLGVYGAKNAFGACLVFVDGVQAYHTAFADALRTAYGEVPTADHPRLTRLFPGQARFKLFDPTGNVLIFIDRNEPEITYHEADETVSEPEKALANAAFLRDTYANDKAAARVLDLALARNEAASPFARARLLAARAELAVAMGDLEQVQAVQHEVQQLLLTGAELAQFRHELQAADALARWIKSKSHA
jgi:hypothetical protein